MMTKIQKWGNSLAVRIPRTIALDTHLSSGKAVDLAVLDGRIVIAPARRPRFRLDELLKGVTLRNRHAECRTGSAVGHEVW
ncbi:MAG: AbrB/MazE/SpoVT family DNA-binding domain-containing protein [Planctomycetota bacterium]